MNVPTFILAFVLGIALLFVLQSPPNQDLFEPGASRFGLDKLPVTDLATVKFRHALRNKPFDIGLFGSSRSWAIGTSHLGLSEGEFFNFSIPGSSIRQTVLFLEMLDEADKLPRLVLISLDNIQYQMYLNPWFPRVPRRWQQGLRDLLMPLRGENIDIGDFSYMAYRHVITEWWALKGVFDVVGLQKRFLCCQNPGADNLSKDGSWREMRMTPGAIEIPVIQDPSFLDSYLVSDLKRIKRLDGNGSKIVIYESPVHPDASRSPAPFESTTRRLLFRTCADLALECIAAPTLGDDGNAPYWGDASHAPPRYLGPWLAEVIIIPAKQRQ
jgi:hypothetical protein